jgi:hypothetical protein
MTDIPYGDCFTVDLRWDVSAVDAPGGGASSSAQQGAGAAGGNRGPNRGQEGAQQGAGAAGSTMSSMGPDPRASMLSLGTTPMVKVDLSLRVPFSRKCLFKRVSR